MARRERAGFIIWVGGGCRDTREPYCNQHGCTTSYTRRQTEICTQSLLLSGHPAWPRRAGRAAMATHNCAAEAHRTHLEPATTLLMCAGTMLTYCSNWSTSGKSGSKKRCPGLNDGVVGINVGLMQPIVIQDP
jgi:hypothetical protein